MRRKETDAIIGMFINTLVLRTKISGDLTFREVMFRVRETTLGAIAHQDLPFEKIVEAVSPPRDLGRNTLFQVNFRVQNSATAELHLPDLRTESLNLVDNDSAKFDLALELPSSSQSRGYFEYNTDLFASRLRKNGRRDLDFLRALRSRDSGESFGIIRWWPEDPFSGPANTLRSWLGRLHRQIPHAD